VKKNGTTHYGDKNSIIIDLTHGFIRRYAVTPANIHTSQMLTHVLVSENGDDFVWVDSGYAGVKFEELLELAGYEWCIHEKRAKNHPRSEEANERNKLRSKVRTQVEHVFVGMTTCMRGKLRLASPAVV
jgi:IS5 family transposase